MCTLCQARDPNIEHHDMHGATNFSDGDVSVSSTRPVYSYDQIADYLTNGFWSDFGTVARHYDVQTGGTITYNLDGLTSHGAETARKALEAWTAVSGLQFQEVAKSAAQMVFDDNNSGAYASSSVAGGHIIKSNINIHSSWSNYGDYYFQTFMHEIGHALGLGHTGDYNGSADYGRDAGYANDSWQTSVMSYFSQWENTWTDATYMYLATLQLGDIAAIHKLYGTPVNVETGDTVYGDGETTGRFGMNLAGNFAVAIVDSGGTDLIDLGSRGYSQHLSLVAETYSNLNGRIGNFSIGRDTVIENVITGSGNDTIAGNAADNRIESGAGNDTILAGGGNDTLIGGTDADTLTGGTGADRFVLNALAESGDTITDFSLADGDRVDVTGLLAAIGYNGDHPVADGILALQAGDGGAWLMVHSGGSSEQLVFLSGVAADADLAAIIGMEDPAPEPAPEPQPEPAPEPQPVSVDTVHVIAGNFRETWTRADSTIHDTDGGIDTLDLGAVDGAVYISLESGAKSWVDGRPLHIAEDTVIENLILGEDGGKGAGNAADNVILGNGGRDRLYGRGGNDTLDGGAGDDVLSGDAGDDTLDGGLGHDRLYGGDGGDVMNGGDGSDQLHGGDGNDILNGGADNDRILSGGGNNVIDGGDGDDIIYAEDGDDVISGGAGNDRIRATGGHNRIDAGSGDNRVHAGSGNDVISAGDGADRIISGDGDDTILAGAGDNAIMSQGGNNSVTAQGGNDWIRLGAGNDVVDAGDGDNRIFAGDGHNLVTAGGGRDRIVTGGGDDTIDAGGGRNSILVGEGSNQVLSGDGDDWIMAGAGDDVISSGGGNDVIRAGGGANFVDAGAGDDRVYTGAGDDVILGGSGDNWIHAGAGDDEISGGAGADVIHAGEGNDIVRGGDGDDRLRGGDGHDMLQGDAGNDVLQGEAGNDLLIGGDGDDWLYGGAGEDILQGGSGFDCLSGGAGADVFVFGSLDGLGDLVRDFDLAEGDLLDIVGVLDALGTTLSAALSSGALTLRAGGSSSWLSVDDDGDAETAALDIAYLYRVDAGSVLDASWFDVA